MTTPENNTVTHAEFQEAMSAVNRRIDGLEATMKAELVSMKAELASMKTEFKSEVKWIGGVVFALNLIVFSGLIHIALSG